MKVCSYGFTFPHRATRFSISSTVTSMPDKWLNYGAQGAVLQALRAHIVEGDIDLAANLPVSVVGDADAARLRDPFETHRNIDAVTKDIVRLARH
jgi:hypothetical protein